MAELVSREAAKVAAKTKMTNDEALARVHVLSITSPATAAWAQNDTIASPVVLPVGTRILGYRVFSGALGTSVTMDIGLRGIDSAQTVIDVDGIADGLDVAAAGAESELSGFGASVFGTAAPILRTTLPSVVYATLLSANPTDDIQFRIDVFVALPG